MTWITLLFIYLIGVVVTVPSATLFGVRTLRAAGHNPPALMVARSKTTTRMAIFWPLLVLAGTCAFMADVTNSLFRFVIR